MFAARVGDALIEMAAHPLAVPGVAFAICGPRPASGQIRHYRQGTGAGPAKYAVIVFVPFAAAGASGRNIMAKTGYESAVMARRYIRAVEVFRENTAAKEG